MRLTGRILREFRLMKVNNEPTLKRLGRAHLSMGFRDFIVGSDVSDEEVSVNFQVREMSSANSNRPMVFKRVKEAPGHGIAILSLIHISEPKRPLYI